MVCMGVRDFHGQLMSIMHNREAGTFGIEIERVFSPINESEMERFARLGKAG